MNPLPSPAAPFVTRVFIAEDARLLPVGDGEAGAAAIAGRVRADCADGRTLVVLIHGFNISGPEAARAYKLAVLQVRRLYPAERFAFLEVYWNGLYGDPMACWPQAMVNSRWAGLGLRALLHQLDPRVPVRVITHSRGAAVISSALWNTSMRGKPAEDRRYEAARAELPPPALDDVRVGLLAPAIRPVEFESYEPVSPRERFVFGINPDDAALKAGGLSWLAGCSLGHRPDLYRDEVAPRLNRCLPTAFMVDLSGSEFHSFEDYLLREEVEGEFLRLLIGERRPELARP